MSLSTPAGLEKIDAILQQVQETASLVRAGRATAKQMGIHVRHLRRCALELNEAADLLDPVAKPGQMVDPNDPKFQALVLALRLVHGPRHRLSDIKPFYGSGVYAIYYCGPLLPYAPISGSETPIYVGKADPDAVSVDPIEQGVRLHARLVEHLNNLKKVKLDPEHFEYRYLPLGDGSQVSVEKVLIDFFRPIWNNEGGCLSGFGKHGDSATTRSNKRSPWDTLHPGRRWAEKNEPKKSHNEILADIADHYSVHPPYSTTAEIVDKLRF